MVTQHWDIPKYLNFLMRFYNHRLFLSQFGLIWSSCYTVALSWSKYLLTVKFLEICVHFQLYQYYRSNTDVPQSTLGSLLYEWCYINEFELSCRAIRLTPVFLLFSMFVLHILIRFILIFFCSSNISAELDTSTSACASLQCFLFDSLKVE